MRSAAVSHGFEHGLFKGPFGGFALVARMERIKRDGAPFPEPARWMKEGSPKLSLAEIFADLFFENPGYFRVSSYSRSLAICCREKMPVPAYPNPERAHPRCRASSPPSRSRIRRFWRSSIPLSADTTPRSSPGKMVPRRRDSTWSGQEFGRASKLPLLPLVGALWAGDWQDLCVDV